MAPETCNDSPCQNQATCIPMFGIGFESKQYLCLCEFPFGGHQCELGELEVKKLLSIHTSVVYMAYCIFSIHIYMCICHYQVNCFSPLYTPVFIIPYCSRLSQTFLSMTSRNVLPLNIIYAFLFTSLLFSSLLLSSLLFSSFLFSSLCLLLSSLNSLLLSSCLLLSFFSFLFSWLLSDLSSLLTSLSNLLFSHVLCFSQYFTLPSYVLFQ